jgi:hypothetical protein
MDPFARPGGQRLKLSIAGDRLGTKKFETSMALFY